MRIKIVLLALAIFLTANSPLPAWAQDPITEMYLDDLEGRVDDVIDRATRSGDYLLKRAGEEAKAAIAALRQASLDILDKAISGVDQQRRKLFENVDNTITRLEADQRRLATDATKLTADFASIVKSIPFTGHDPEVYDYGPRVILPVGSEEIPVQVYGPRIGNADPAFGLNDAPVSVKAGGDNELVALVKRASLAFHDNDPKYVTFPFHFSKSTSVWWNPFSWWSAEPIERQMTFLLLPKTMGTATIESKVKTFTPEASSHNWPHVGGVGRDNSYRLTLTLPPDLTQQGWVIDIDTLLTQGNAYFGENAQTGGSSCTGYDRGTLQPTSFVFEMQHGHTSNGFGGKSDGSIDCRVTVPLKRTVEGEDDAPVIQKILNWTDDELVPLPANLKSFKLSVKMFDSRSYIVTERTPEPHGIVEVTRTEGGLFFHPNPPVDF